MCKPIIVFLFLAIFFGASFASSLSVFDSNYYRDAKGGIWVDTVSKPVQVDGKNVQVRWGYPVENYVTPYKQVWHEFTFSYDMPLSVAATPASLDPCAGDLSFITSTGIDDIEVLWDYNICDVENYVLAPDLNSAECIEQLGTVVVGKDVKQQCIVTEHPCINCVRKSIETCETLKDGNCFYYKEFFNGTYSCRQPKGWTPIGNLDSCPMTANQTYSMRHNTRIGAGSTHLWDVNALFNVASKGIADQFVFVIPAPSWVSNSSTEFDLGDYNHTYTIDSNSTSHPTNDGNLSPRGTDLNYAIHGFYDPTLLGYWKLDSTDATKTFIYDDSNNGVLGTLRNDSNVFGAGLFDTNAFWGSDPTKNTHIDINQLTNYDADKNLTIIAWIKPSTYSGQHAIVAQMGCAGEFPFGNAEGYDFSLQVNDATSGTFYFQTWYKTGGECAASALNGNAIIYSDRWYHVAATIERVADIGSDKGVVKRLYLNGNLDATSGASIVKSYTGGVTGSRERIGKGQTASGGGDSFNGLIDEVRIYQRLFSADEITRDYNAFMNSDWESPIFDSTSPDTNWNWIDWNQSVDVNNSVTVDYRSCDDPNCSGESWTTGLSGNDLHFLESAMQNQYFQYRVNFDSNRAAWNPFRENALDPGFIPTVGNITIDYSPDTIPPFIVSLVPDENKVTTNRSPSFSATYSEPITECGVRIYLNHVVVGYDYGTIDGNTCYYTITFDLNESDDSFVDFNALDNYNNLSDYNRSSKQVYHNPYIPIEMENNWLPIVLGFAGIALLGAAIYTKRS